MVWYISDAKTWKSCDIYCKTDGHYSSEREKSNCAEMCSYRYELDDCS